jgi:hypothetical protein
MLQLNYKIYLFAFLFFGMTQTAFGAVICETPITVDEYNGGTTAQKWGDSNAKKGVGEITMRDYEFLPTTLTVTLAKNGTPVDMVYALITMYDPFYGAFRYIKSESQTIASTTAQDYTFTFSEPKIVPRYQLFVFGISRTGSANAQAYNLYGDVLSDFDGWITDEYAYTHDGVTVGATYNFEGLECTDQQTATTSTDVTEAVYTIGYNIQIYLGILLLMLFGYLGYTFTRRYI